MRQPTCSTREHRARGSARGGESLKRIAREGRDEYGYSTSMVIRMNWLRRCAKCDALIRFSEMDAHRKVCQVAGRMWFEGLAENEGNVAAIAAKLNRRDK